MAKKKQKPSLELTNASGDEQASNAGSYVRENGELVLQSSTKVVNPFGGNRPFIEPDEPRAQQPAPVANLVDQAINQVVEAIGSIDPNDRELWTKQSGPKLSALQEILGDAVTDDVRAAAWEIYKSTQET